MIINTLKKLEAIDESIVRLYEGREGHHGYYDAMERKVRQLPLDDLKEAIKIFYVDDIDQSNVGLSADLYEAMERVITEEEKELVKCRELFLLEWFDKGGPFKEYEVEFAMENRIWYEDLLKSDWESHPDYDEKDITDKDIENTLYKLKGENNENNNN